MLSNKFVFVDHVQFRKVGWQNRNRIRTKDGWIWLTVPVLKKGRLTQKICDVEINNSVNWKDKHWKSIYYNYRNSPYFSDYRDFFEKIYSSNWNKLVDLNKAATKFFFDMLGINIETFSSSSFSFTGKKTDLLVEMCRKLGADTYLSGCGPGAKKYIDETKFAKSGLHHRFQEFTHPVYRQQYEGFIPNLSVIDLLFNHGNEKSRELIRQSGEVAWLK